MRDKRLAPAMQRAIFIRTPQFSMDLGDVAIFYGCADYILR